MNEDLLRRVRSALHDAERWTAKYCADNHDKVEPGMPYEAARRALDRVTSVRSEINALNIAPNCLGDLNMAMELIQEAKGDDGPKGGFVTDHLDAAESHLEKVRSFLLAKTNP